MMDLKFEQFSDYFHELHGVRPYSWQTRLAKGAIDGEWPGAIDLPTASGKTACIDVAVFALACQAGRSVEKRTAPRRVFFCVNRRVIVDEAYQRARRIAKKLWDAERNQSSDSPVLVKVARALRRVAGTKPEDDAPPLDILELRGGIYRDNRWARSAAQPTVLCTTIDQLGSRLLFRGYGVSPNAAPIQAALIAYGSLVLLDEAHISKPFQETLQHVERYLDPSKWAREAIGARPMTVVPMTATPLDQVAERDVIRLDARDRENESLDRRLKASKRATLLRVGEVSKAIVEHAEAHAKTGNAAIGIIVNRVATAKDIYKFLHEIHPDVELVIGGMRPIDRDEQSKRLISLVGPKRPAATEKTSFVVSTQCLEVGADYDFDVLITECASLDALRQRFGRLNRGGRKVEARAVIVMKDKDVKPDGDLDDAPPLDPIYGNALVRTWNWLWERADVENPPEALEGGETAVKRPKGKAKPPVETRDIDFGIDAFDALLKQHDADGRSIPDNLLAPSASSHAPVMLPAHVDFWCQTSPIPVPDPAIALFIHGPQHGEPDVQVCWRADLIEDEHMNRVHWPDVVALLPPTAAECMSVPISRVRRWLLKEAGSTDLSDLLEVARQPEEDSKGPDREGKERTAIRSGVLWRGAEKSKLIESLDDLRPGDTLVLPIESKGWDDLGHVPAEASSSIDVAEAAFGAARDRRVLRLHPSLSESLPKNAGFTTLLDRIAKPGDSPNLVELKDLLREAKELSEGDTVEALKEFLNHGFVREPYPDGRGIVLTARRRTGGDKAWFLPSLDEGDDSSSRIRRKEPVPLADHTDHVVQAVDDTLEVIHAGVSKKAYRIAATLHDWGKIDDRMQAWLRDSGRTDAWLCSGTSPALLAKSDGEQTPRERRWARERAGLPDGFRHEMLSVQLAERPGILKTVAADHDLILHLIAAHHGHGRPFAPVVLDDDPPDVEYEGAALSSADRRDRASHRLDSGIAERFWSLTRRYGWWGLAYLESLLRLADQQASADEDSGKHDPATTPQPAEATP